MNAHKTMFVLTMDGFIAEFFFHLLLRSVNVNPEEFTIPGNANEDTYSVIPCYKLRIVIVQNGCVDQCMFPLAVCSPCSGIL